MKNAYHITKLSWLTKQQEQAAAFVAGLTPSEAGIDQALAYLRHLFGFEQVAFNTQARSIVVKGLFVASPVTKPTIL